MKKEEIHFGDLHRWLIGYTTPQFMIEVAVRTTLIYLILFMVVRMMGKRMTSQLTVTELAVMITLGAIVSPAMQLPDRGLMFGVVGLLVAVVFQRGLNLWAFYNPKVERITQGTMVTLVKDGVLILDELRKVNITRQQVFAKLREANIQNLGNVKRVYLEASGIFSIFENDKNLPGLPVFPPNDPVLRSVQDEAAGDLKACRSCGHVQRVTDENTSCPVCYSKSWISAYATKADL